MNDNNKYIPPTTAEILETTKPIGGFHGDAFIVANTLMGWLDGLPCYYKFTMDSANNHCETSNYEDRCPPCQFKSEHK